MNKILFFLVTFCLLLAASAYSERLPKIDPLLLIEEKILADDFKDAHRVLSKSFYYFINKGGSSYFREVEDEVRAITKYFNNVAKFRKLNVPGSELSFTIYAKTVMATRDEIPNNRHFSQKVYDKIKISNDENDVLYQKALPVAKQMWETEKREELELKKQEEEKARTEELEIEKDEAIQAALEKECGKDYGKIRVGMSLKRVNKCYGELYLHGQVKWDGGTVDYYTRDGTYVYAKTGKVVAWGE